MLTLIDQQQNENQLKQSPLDGPKTLSLPVSGINPRGFFVLVVNVVDLAVIVSRQIPSFRQRETATPAAAIPAHETATAIAHIIPAAGRTTVRT